MQSFAHTPSKNSPAPSNKDTPIKKKKEKKKGGDTFSKESGKIMVKLPGQKKRYTYKTVLEHIKAQFRTKIKILNII